LWDQFQLRESELSALRILVIHSGGASQRLPVYSPLGKIFAPLPLLRPDGQICTLFDHLYLTLAGLPPRLGPGMLIVAGDVFLVFDDRQVGTPNTAVTALTISVPAEMGLGHGVFVTDAHERIQQTLQKAPVSVMRESGAVDQRGNVLIDTGLLFFDVESTVKLARLAGTLAEGRRWWCTWRGTKPEAAGGGWVEPARYPWASPKSVWRVRALVCFSRSTLSEPQNRQCPPPATWALSFMAARSSSMMGITLRYCRWTSRSQSRNRAPLRGFLPSAGMTRSNSAAKAFRIRFLASCRERRAGMVFLRENLHSLPPTVLPAFRPA
jgi:hypothetical protein